MHTPSTRPKSATPAASVILSTYNSPDRLRLALAGYSAQSTRAFEILIADDGSNPPPRDLIEAFRLRSDISISHVWHEDEGFRKNRILNRAILAANSPYIIVSDGDCIPRADFVAVHLAKRRPNHYLSGGYTKLTPDISRNLSVGSILSQQCFSPRWLRQNGLKITWRSKLYPSGRRASLLNFLTPTTPKWNGITLHSTVGAGQPHDL